MSSELDAQCHTYCAQKAVIALNNLCSGVEEQECTSSEGTFGFATFETLVTDQGALLISDQSTDRDTLQRAVCDVAVYMGSGNELRQYGMFQSEELQESRIPLEFLQVHEKRA